MEREKRKRKVKWVNKKTRSLQLGAEEEQIIKAAAKGLGISVNQFFVATALKRARGLQQTAEAFSSLQNAEA